MQLDAAGVGGDRGRAVRPAGHRGAHGGQGAAGVAAGEGDVEVDAALGQGGGRGQLLGCAEHEVGEGEGVDPHVQQGAGAQRGVEEAVVRTGGDHEAELGTQLARGAEVAGVQALAQLADDRVARAPHRLHEEDVVLAGQPHHLLRVAGVEGQRLLAHHVLAGLDRHPGVLEVQGVGGGDVDDLDVGVGDQVGVRRVGAGTGRVLGHEGLGRLQAARADGDQARGRDQGEVGGHGACDLAGGQEAPADGLAGGGGIVSAGLVGGVRGGHRPTLRTVPGAGPHPRGLASDAADGLMTSV